MRFFLRKKILKKIRDWAEGFWDFSLGGYVYIPPPVKLAEIASIWLTAKRGEVGEVGEVGIYFVIFS